MGDATSLVAAPFGALYLHMPFCVRRCRYCDFATAATCHDDPLVAAYAGALETLARRVSLVGLLGGVRTAYLGGGTPTMAGEKLAGLVACVRGVCPDLAEFSSEANPESLTAALAASLARAGLTRISLGVQSTVDAELARLGRAHDRAGALAAARVVCAAGLDLSCDLMAGIPLQTPASWEHSLHDVLEAGATHVSCYPLMVEDGTPLAAAVEAGEEREPDDDLQADLMLAAARVLGNAGLTRYEVASYAAPGKACAHNIAYWTGVPYLGLGSSAASMMGPEGLLALAEALPLAVVDAGESVELPATVGVGAGDGRQETPAAYLARHPEAARIRLRMLDDARNLVYKVGARGPLACEIESLTAREAAAEDLMLAMRMSAGAPSALLEQAVDKDGIPRLTLERACADIVGRGLAAWTAEGALAPTERGWLLGNELYGAMWDLA